MKVNLVLLKVGGNNKAFSLPSSVTIVGRRQITEWNADHVDLQSVAPTSSWRVDGCRCKNTCLLEIDLLTRELLLQGVSCVPAGRN